MNALTQQLKRLSDDERGVSPVVGFVLIFALIMIVFTLYQSSVVPAQNKEVEFKHSQTVEGQMSELNDAIQQAGASGVPQSATIATGVQYPDRALAINPGSPAGTLKTSNAPSGNPYAVTIENVKATSGDSKYFDSSNSPNPFEFESKELVYGISYNVYQQDPTVTVAPGLQFAQFKDGSVVQSTDIVSGNKIDLTLLDPDSDYQQSAIASSVDVKPTSSSTEYMTIESPDSTNPQITIKTSLSLTTTEAIDRFEANLESNDKVTSATYDASGSPNKVTLTLKDETYQFRVSEVGVGTVSEREQYYLTSEDSTTNPTVEVGKPETLTVSVHDQLGNPDQTTVDACVFDGTNCVSGSGTGMFARSSAGSVDDVATDDNGRVTFSYTPSDTEAGSTVKIRLTLDNGVSGDSDLETVIYELDVSDDDSASGNPNDIGGDIDNGYALDPSRRVTIDSATASGGSVDFEFNNRGGTDMTVTRIQFSGYAGHFPSSSFATEGRFADTSVELNGQTVLLNNQFTLTADSTATRTLSNLDVNKVQTGLLIISVKYKYTEEGTTKTDTATYSVPVLK